MDAKTNDQARESFCPMMLGIANPKQTDYKCLGRDCMAWKWVDAEFEYGRAHRDVTEKKMLAMGWGRHVRHDGRPIRTADGEMLWRRPRGTARLGYCGMSSGTVAYREWAVDVVRLPAE